MGKKKIKAKKKTFKKFAVKGMIWSKDSWRTNRGILLNYLLIHWNQ